MTDAIRLDDAGFVTIRINIRLLALSLIGFCIALPPIYMLVMMRIGAIRFPYWDHLETAKQIIAYFDGTLTWASMLEPQAQARPLIPRLVFVGTAALTRWDIRAEFVVLFATLYGTLALLLGTAWRLTAGTSLQNRLVAMLLVSLLACSPAGAMNQEWSLMLIATICYLATLAAFVLVAFNLRSWGANVAAAGLAWIATYSMGQGLFIFPLVIAAHQIANRSFVPSRLSVFWLINMVACYALFLPGLPTGDEHPTLAHFVAFVFIYIGNPLGELLWFPFHGAIDLRYTFWINLASGIAITLVALFTAWRAVREDSQKAVLFLLFAGYGGACAGVTAWGRAVGPLAIESANASRYSVFAACILFGLIFYYATEMRVRKPQAVALCLLLALCSVSYARAVQVFLISGDQNIWLAAAYAPQGAPSEFDAKVFPDVAHFQKVKADLYRLKIGPYRLVDADNR